MIALIIRRFIQSFFVMLAVAMVSFLLFRYVGDPISQMVGMETSIADREQLREELGLNDPVIVQFASFAFNTMRGQFGISFQLGRPVNELFIERLPATLELSIVAAFFSLLVGVPMGVYTGLHPDRGLSKIFQAVSLIGISLPTFLIGILLILFFGVLLRWLPTFGRGEVIDLVWWNTGLLTVSGLKAIIMPAFTLGMFQMTLIMRLVRSEMLDRLCQVCPSARADQSCGSFQPCVKKYAGSGHYHHRASTRFADCLCDYHRNRVSMAGDGTAVSSVDSICRHSGDVHLSHPGCVFLRYHQFDRGYPLSRGGSTFEVWRRRRIGPLI